MITYRCDGCGREMNKADLRYTVTIDVRAAYNDLEIGLADLVRSHRDEILALLERLRDVSPKEVEAQIYKKFTLDLCPSCHKQYLLQPINIHGPETRTEPNVQVDALLRSLGFGNDPQH